MADLLRVGLAARLHSGTKSKRSIIKEDPQTRLPFIACSADAPARQMTAAQIIAIEQQTQIEEDLERLGASP